MKRARTGKTKSMTSKAAARSMSSGVAKRASLFRNGANQAVRLPQELRFPADVKEVRIRKQGDGLFITPVKPNWSSFFALQGSSYRVTRGIPRDDSGHEQYQAFLERVRSQDGSVELS